VVAFAVISAAAVLVFLGIGPAVLSFLTFMLLSKKLKYGSLWRVLLVGGLLAVLAVVLAIEQVSNVGLIIFAIALVAAILIPEE
jgi:hypothetical protein